MPISRPRPALPWFLEDKVHDNNPFNTHRTPGSILAYLYGELPPEVTVGVLDGVIDAGAGQLPLLRCVIELTEMGHDELAERVMEAAHKAPEKPMGMTETEFQPERLKTADEVTLLATAAITKMLVRERMEGVPVQDREN
jgi:hypothetical protein